MAKKIYVGNLPYSIDDNALNEMFSECGALLSANVIMDRMTGRSKGFGFVEMENDGEADAAIQKFDGADCDGRTLKVSEAKPREERPRR